MSMWFVLLTLATTWSLLFLAHSITMDPELSESDLVIEPNTFLLFVFLILAGKALIETLHRAVESKELVMVITQPVHVRQVAYGKFLGILMSNLTVVAYGLAVMTVIQLGSFVTDRPLIIDAPYPDGSGALWLGHLGINHFNIMDVILLSVLASIMGFTYSIFNSLPVRKRVGGLFLYSLLLMPVWVFMREVELLPWYQTTLLALVVLLALGGLHVATGQFQEAWVKQTSGKSRMFFQKRSWGRLRLLDRMFSPITGRLMRKELVINVQKKEILGNLIAILGLSALLIWGWVRLESVEDIPASVAEIAYPAIISIGIYLAAVLQCGLIGLGSVGKEGRKFWILRTQPVHHERVFKAKALAILALSPVTILGVSLPLPMILGYSPWWVLFFVIMTLTMIFVATGIGLLMGATYPNFNESTGGMPDVMSMYLLMLMCLMFGGVLLIFGGYAMQEDLVKGLLSAIITLEVGFIIMIVGIRVGSWIYSRTEPRQN